MRRITAAATLSRSVMELAQVSARSSILGHPPSGPSCSRWLSCSCCRRNDLSRGKQALAEKPTGQAFRLGETEAHNPAIPPLSTLQYMQMPHLPLPPQLPWSPDSAPFLRHMQILSLALLSPSADQSWEVFEALHPDLRAAIPDDVFISLLAHQFGEKKHHRRVIELLKIGRECGMNPLALATNTMESVMEILLRRFQASGSSESAAGLVDWLWPSFMKQNGNAFANIPFDIRQRWLNYLIVRHKDDCDTVFAALEAVIEQTGSGGLRPTCSRIVAMYEGNDPTRYETSLRLATWCMARDIAIHVASVQTILVRFNDCLARRGEDGIGGVSTAVKSLINELNAGGADRLAHRLNKYLGSFLESQRTPQQVARSLLSDPNATMPEVSRAVAKLIKTKDLDEGDWDIATNLCRKALTIPNARDEAIFWIFTRGVAERKASPRHIVRLAKCVLESDVLEHDTLSPPLLNRLFCAVVDVLDLDTTAFNVCCRLYNLVRASDKEPAKWSNANTQRWLKVFYHTLGSRKLLFASRLYADFQSDGLVIPRTAQLAFIRKICETQSPSRRVLLDRHVKDYLWDSDVPTEPLVLDVCRGLSKSPDDAAMAVNLCRHIAPKDPLPPLAVAALVTPLLTSARKERRNQGLALLTELPASEDSRPAYHAAINALRSNAAKTGASNLVHVYNDMTSKGIRSNSTTVSLVINALLKADELESAKSAYDAAVELGHVLHPAAISSLMIKLALAGRVDEAYAVDAKWWKLVRRRGGNTAKVAARVYGARLLVDIKAGRDIDLAQFVDADGAIIPRDGWNPTRPFFRWLEEVQHKQRGEKASELVFLLDRKRGQNAVQGTDQPESELEPKGNQAHGDPAPVAEPDAASEDGKKSPPLPNVADDARRKLGCAGSVWHPVDMGGSLSKLPVQRQGQHTVLSVSFA